MKFQYISILITSLLLISFSNLQAQIYDDPSDLAEAVNAALNGGTFILKNGTTMILNQLLKL